jgi:RsiW-degrading membrane proteinase PrsW (M82 family)
MADTVVPAPGGSRRLFNPPPGWEVPDGWEPPPGWQPDSSWPPAPPGWEFWSPTDGRQDNANDLSVTFDSNRQVFGPEHVVRVGRAPDNDIVVGYSSVSRRHAQVSRDESGAWVFENVGQAPTFEAGQTVARISLTRPVELTLGSPYGPVLRLEPGSVPPPAPRASQDPQTMQLSAAAAGPGFGPLAASGDELMSALRILIPIRSWLHNPDWRQGLRLLVITYALLPLLFIALFATSGNLTTPGWAYSLYIAPLWAIGFWWLIRPGPVRKLEVWAGVGIIVWTLLWINLVTININDRLAKAGHSLSFPVAIAVAFNEEITKALPVFLAGIILLKLRSTKLDTRMWMFLGTIAGLTFGVSESAIYTSQAITTISGAQVASQAVSAVLAFAERVFVDGFQHAVWAGISCFFIGMGLNYRRRRVQLVVLGVSMAALLHALNDWSLGFFNSYWPWILIQAFSLFLFLGYTISAAAIEQKVRQTPLFRGESIIMESFWNSDQDGKP